MESKDPAFMKYWLRMGVPREMIERIAVEVYNKAFPKVSTMKDRINRHEMLMEMANIAAQRSTCLRHSVGCVIARDGRPIVMGYNGAPAGKPHCTPENCGDKPCTNAVHAEANAIAYAARKGIMLEGAWLYCLYSPCQKCAELILGAGIQAIVFEKLYRDTAPLDFMYYDIAIHNRIQIYQVDNLPDDGHLHISAYYP